MRTRTKALITAGVLLLIIVVIGGIKALQIRALISSQASAAQPPEAVTSAKAKTIPWRERTPATATLVAEHSVVLTAEVPGKVREILFDSGRNVRAGEVLVRLDTSTENAQLAAALADAKLRSASYERAKILKKGGASSPQEYDVARAQAQQAQAQVENLRSVIAKKTIRAPFDGRVDIRQVDLGQLVSSGTAVASIQSIDPMYADFWLPQDALASISLDQEVTIHAPPFPDANWSGHVSAINAQVDPSTRNVRVRAIVPNLDGRLRQGMFVNLELFSPVEREVLVIPATAIVFAPYGDSVFRLEHRAGPDGGQSLVAVQQFIRSGGRLGDLMEVVSGLRAGEEIVSSGAFKLRNGAPVVVQNELAPEAELAPQPPEG